MFLGPTGRLSKGHVLDVSVEGISRAIKDYDSQLYIKWEPKKLRGWGCWEIRRKPLLKSIVDVTEFDGQVILKLDYKEDGFTNHVLDCAFLNYDLLRKLQSMDTFKEGATGFAERLERREEEHKKEVKEKARQEMIYAGKQNKAALNDFREYILSGNNPADIAEHWGNKKGQ